MKQTGFFAWINLPLATLLLALAASFFLAGCESPDGDSTGGGSPSHEPSHH